MNAEESIRASLDPVPSLKEAAAIGGVNVSKLSVAVETNGRNIRVEDRHRVTLSDGSKPIQWTVPSLRELFRGDRLPPPDLNHYPPAYVKYFFEIERPLLMVCDAIGDPSDQEMEEIYSNLRRRPDGRSLGPMHDFVWQCAALMLGLYVVSEKEFEGVLGQLARSASGFALKPVSRNYLGYLRSSIGSLKGKAGRGS
jgi:hypothetical protein